MTAAARKTATLPVGPARTMLAAAGLSRDDAERLVEDAMDFNGPQSLTEGGVRYTVTGRPLDMFFVVVTR